MHNKAILSALVGILTAALLKASATAAITIEDFHSVIYAGNDPQALGEFSAATVTDNEAGLDAIFSQASFGANTVDIRFNAIKTLTDSTLVDITTDTELTNLLNNAINDSSPTVNMYFVDTIDACGGFNVSIVGCAFRPGNALVVESAIAAGANGAEVQAHEIGHNLGLAHIVEANLMTGSLNGVTTLSTSVTETEGGDTVNQISTVLASPLIQTDGGGQRFIEINPILVQAGAVPEPTATAFLGLAGLFLVGRRRR